MLSGSSHPYRRGMSERPDPTRRLAALRSPPPTSRIGWVPSPPEAPPRVRGSRGAHRRNAARAELNNERDDAEEPVDPDGEADDDSDVDADAASDMDSAPV